MGGKKDSFKNSMRVALVHDYISEFGGAERVLLTLSEIWPDAPIYTAFYKDGQALERFKGRDIRVSWVHWIPGFAGKLHSPLRLLTPFIWGSFDFRDYDVVISSSSWYITKGFRRSKDTIEICYCHTPPRYLYGYQMSTELGNSLLGRIHEIFINPFLRMYDRNAAQRVDYFIANSKEVKKRIEKFYKRDAVVVYPPVEVPQIPRVPRGEYYLIVARVAGGKGLELAIDTANKYGFPLKIVGAPAGSGVLYNQLKKKALPNVEFLGFVEDSKLVELHAGAKAFLALSRDEDFGITPVESMLAGTSVVAYEGGGYLETVIDGKTGVFFKDYTPEGLCKAMQKLEKLKIKPQDCIKQGERFSKERFKEEIGEFVKQRLRNNM